MSETVAATRFGAAYCDVNDLKPGDLVGVIAVPPLLPENPETREVFARCLSRVFPVIAICRDLDIHHVELEVGAVMAAAATIRCDRIGTMLRMR